jgi:hypothetical protein
LLNSRAKSKTLSRKQNAYYENSLSSIVSVQTDLQAATSKKYKHELIKRKRKIILPLVYGVERYKMGDNYAPSPTSGNFKELYYVTNTIKSNDAFILRNGSKFYPTRKGIWSVSATCLVTPNSAAALAWSSHELHLYKNGVFYSILDANTLVTTFGIVQNYYDIFDQLQGTDILEINPNDYFEIKYAYTSTTATNMGVTDYFSGYINIQYLTNQSETI